LIGDQDVPGLVSKINCTHSSERLLICRVSAPSCTLLVGIVDDHIFENSCFSELLALETAQKDDTQRNIHLTVLTTSFDINQIK